MNSKEEATGCQKRGKNLITTKKSCKNVFTAFKIPIEKKRWSRYSFFFSLKKSLNKNFLFTRGLSRSYLRGIQ